MKFNIGPDRCVVIDASGFNIHVELRFCGRAVYWLKTRSKELLLERKEDWMTPIKEILSQPKLNPVIDHIVRQPVLLNVWEREQVLKDELTELASDYEVLERKFACAQRGLLEETHEDFAGQVQSAAPTANEKHDAAIATAENSEAAGTTPSPAPVNLGSLSTATEVEPHTILPSEY